MRCVPVAVVFVYILSCCASAQDIRVSPPEPLQYDLPAEYRIQAVDTTMDYTLIVWETSRLTANNSVAGELQFQIFRHKEPISQQLVLTDTSARPIYHVQVVALTGSFLVLWEDRRAHRPGLYARQINLDGQLMGEERYVSGIITPHKQFGRTIAVGGTASKGRLLLWHENVGSTTQLNTLRISPNGLFSPIERKEGILEGLYRYRSLPGFCIVSTSRTRFAVHDNGVVDNRTVISPYHGYVHSDSTLYSIRDKELVKFSSLFSDEPDYSVPLHCLDSATPSATMMSLDSTSVPTIHFIVVEEPSDSNNHSKFRVALYKVLVVDSVATEPVLLSEDLRYHGIYNPVGGHGGLYEFTGSSYTQGSDNTAGIAVNWDYTSIIHYTHQPVEKVEKRWFLSHEGNIQYEETAFIGWQPQTSPSIRRYTAGGRENISVLIDGTLINIASTGLPWRLSTPQRLPQLFGAADGTYFCSWFDNETSHVLNTVDFAASKVDLIDRLIIDRSTYPVAAEEFGVTYGVVEDLESQTLRHSDDYVNFDRGLIIVDNYSERLDYRLRYYSEYWKDWTSVGHRCRVYGAGANGWTSIYSTGTQPVADYTDLSYTEGKPLGYLSSRNELILGFYKVKFDAQSVASNRYSTLRGIDAEGKTVWEQSTGWIKGSPAWIAVDSVQILLVRDEEGVMIRGEKELFTFPLEPVVEGTRITSLNDSLFLRMYPIPEGSIMIECWSVYGNFRGRTVVQQNFDTLVRYGYATLYRPADQTVLLLRGSDVMGIRGTLLDIGMTVYMEDIAISEKTGKALNPSGIFVGDTLMVLWEDYRNDNADIYGNVLKIPLQETAIGKETRREGRRTLQNLHPNPARTGVRLSFNGSGTGMTTVEVFDMLGRKALTRSIQAGADEAWIDLQALQPGLCILRWSTTGCSGSRPLSIVP